MKQTEVLVVSGILLTCLALVACARVVPPGASSVAPSEAMTPTADPPAQKTYPPPDISKPFVIWDGETVIPFIHSVREGAADANIRVFFLGLWDPKKGTVSFAESPLFSLNGPNRVCWDGGDRFAFDGGVVTQLDPRIRVEHVDVQATDSRAGRGYLLAAPSASDALFITYMGADGKPVLDILNHPLAGRATMDLPELAPGTSILGPVAIESGSNEVRVYFETSRMDIGVDSAAPRFVQGILQASYRPAAKAPPVRWRIINPEVPAFVASGGTKFSQFRGEIVMSTQGRRPETLDLRTGAVRTPSEFGDELKKADPSFINGDSADLCYGFGKYRIVEVNRLLGSGAKQFSHIFAFSGDNLVGRIECIGDQVLVFKDGVKSLDIDRPQGGGGVFQFPQDVEPLSDPGSVDGTIRYEEYDAIWSAARYADLFNEPLHTDGALAEKIASILMKRFAADPTGFVRALAVASVREVKIVGDFLAYNADYGDLNAYRKQVEGLKKDFPSGKELDVLDKLLDQIAQFQSRKGKKPGQ